MYHMIFDDFKRALEKKRPDVQLKVLKTTIVGTPDWDAYLGIYLMPENTEVELTYDGHTATFYRIEKKEPKHVTA